MMGSVDGDKSPLFPSLVIPMGLDLGSLYARIAISDPVSTLHQTDSCGNGGSTASSTLPSVISNELGDRYTLTMYAVEQEHDEKEEEVYIFGDAARRSLQRRKMNTDSFGIQEILKQNVQTDALVAFFRYLFTMTSHAASQHPSALGLVLSVPPSFIHISNLCTCVQSGWIQSMRIMGWDNHPSILTCTRTKKDKKKYIQDLETQSKCILQVISEPVAVLFAHGLFDSHITLAPALSITSTFSSWSWAIVVDWGYSSLKISLIQNISITTHTQVPPSSLASIHSHQMYPQYSGKTLSNLLVEHVIQSFTTTRRISEPIGSLPKIQARVQLAVEEAVRTFCKGSSNQAWIALDGLYEGIDCHMSIPSHRWDRMIQPLLNEVENILLTLKSDLETQENVAVLSSGAMVSHPQIVSMMDRVFDPSNYFRGKGRDVIPPEEAIAMGCSMYASTLLSDVMQPFVRREGMSGSRMEWLSCFEPAVTVKEEVDMSPVHIALCLSVETGLQRRLIPLIKKGFPLPARVVHRLESSWMTHAIEIVQLFGNDDEQMKLLCRLGNAHVNSSLETDSFDITVLLTTEGELLVSFNHDPWVRI